MQPYHVSEICLKQVQVSKRNGVHQTLITTTELKVTEKSLEINVRMETLQYTYLIKCHVPLSKLKQKIDISVASHD